MTDGFWPWWLSAGALAGVTVASCVVARRPFGVSGIVGRLVHWRAEAAAERSRTDLASADEAALEAALLAATAEAFGEALPAAVAAGPAEPPAPASVTEAPAGPACQACSPPAPDRPPLSAHVVFLAAIVIGAFVCSALGGHFHPTLALPEAYARVVASGPLGYLWLAAGGLLVGVGTAVSGGCTTGHGLTGCARLQPASLAATVTYFGVAVAVSFLLAGRLA